jgi:hypothetical protein
VARTPFADELRFARMAGSSIAAPAAAPWVTDFLNAAYFARPDRVREVDDLRLAFCVLTTRWWSQGCDARLGARDVVAFHRAFGGRRLRTWPVGTLSREGLLAGAAALLGDWFPAAYADDARRAYGIAFPTVEERDAFEPSLRLRHAALGELTRPQRPPGEQSWSHYPAVPLPSLERAAALLLAPERWPDIAADAGRFTPLRRGGLPGQTFEIEVAAGGGARAPVYTRGYVTAVRVLSRGDEGLAPWLAEVAEGAGEPTVPEGAEVHLAVELVTHEGHFLGRGISRVLAFAHEGRGWARDVGSWDPMPWHLQASYVAAGKSAQHAFWGPEHSEASMLAQLALVTA